jgi:hypothetical protein
MQYENKIINSLKDGNPDSEFELNELGKEGWRLVAINNYKFYFIRFILTLCNPSVETPVEFLTSDCIHPGSYIDAGGWHCPACGENKNI